MRVFPIVLMLMLAAALAPAGAYAGCCPCDCCWSMEDSESTALRTVVFHLPLAFNDGTPVPDELLEDVLADIVEVAGGFTYYEATGGWMFKGRLYREPVWVVKVGLKEEQVNGFFDLIETRLKDEFKQEAVWVEESGSAEVL